MRLLSATSGSLALGLVAALAAACTAQDNITFVIVKNQVPDEGCIIPTDDDGLYVSTGRLDVSELPGGLANPGYVFTPLVRNGASSVSGNPNENVIFLGGADIELIAGTTQASIDMVGTLAAAGMDKRTQLVSGSVSPGGTAALGFFAIDADQTATLAGLLAPGAQAQLVARIRIFGRIDGAEIVSSKFDYPITVCNGCLLQDLGSCATFSPTQPIGQGGQCSPLQDAVLSCCTSTTGAGVVCPAVHE
jgi:hypothetical protein